jgi:hypothetical protein
MTVVLGGLRISYILADLTVITIFVEMLKFQKHIFLKNQHFVNENGEYFRFFLIIF